ncbi:hypothetical protein [Nonomuraea dietziae]|uniref:hypothetical protein n=1 Tax=Nonomuraea dietziae TaxID=65515 RepID=UPI0034034365
MLAIVAAIIFGLGFLLELLAFEIPGGISGVTFMLLGLCLLALHQAGVGAHSDGGLLGGRRGTRR